MERVICLGIGYLFGLFQSGFFYGKAHGIDIREHGSGNSGTTNTLRVLGTKAGLIVFAGDCLKTILAIFVVRLIFGESCKDWMPLLSLYAGAGAILGHNYPFYMNFKGGKGIAATAGMVIAFNPYFTIVGIVVFFGLFFTTHYVSLGSLSVYVVLMGMMLICGQTGLLFATMPASNRYEMYILFFLLLLLAFWKHKENIKRLISGTERKTYLGKKNKAEIDLNHNKG